MCQIIELYRTLTKSFNMDHFQLIVEVTSVHMLLLAQYPAVQNLVFPSHPTKEALPPSSEKLLLQFTLRILEVISLKLMVESCSTDLAM